MPRQKPTMRKGRFGVQLNEKQVKRVKERRIIQRSRPVKKHDIQASYWTRRERLRVECDRRSAAQTRSRKQLYGVARFLSELNLPFLAPGHNQSNLSEEKILEKLRWTFEHIGAPHEDLVSYLPEEEIPFPQYERKDRPPLNVPPTRSPQYGIHNFLIHLFSVLQRGALIALPTQWQVFSEIDWDDNAFVAEPSDSDCAWRMTSVELNEVEPGPIRKGSKHSEEISLHCLNRSLEQTRLRKQWDLLASMCPSRFLWTYQSEDMAVRRDNTRHAGRLDYNQSSTNQDIWPQSSLLEILRLWEFGKKPSFKKPAPVAEELECRHKFGRLIANAVATSLFPAEYRAVIHWPMLLSQGKRPAIVDYACRGSFTDQPSSQELPLILFVAQYANSDIISAVKTMAHALQPMMTLFILYYLDTRLTREERMPSWMVLYGVVYDEEGISIQAFFPSFPLPTAGADFGPSAKWAAFSRSVFTGQREAMRYSPDKRGKMLGILPRIQGHARYVLAQLQLWDGYGRICNKLPK